jgi:3-oxoacyl-[acyl-carrier protein] reductase
MAEEITSEHAASSSRLDGRVAIVTSSSCGIGHAIAILLHSLGARVVLNYASSSTKAGLLMLQVNKSRSSSV